MHFFVWTGLEQAHFAGAALQFHDNMDLRDHKCPAKIEFILVDGFTVGGKSRILFDIKPGKKWQKLVTRVAEVIRDEGFGSRKGETMSWIIHYCCPNGPL